MVTAERISEPYYQLKMVMDKKKVSQKEIAGLLGLNVSSVNEKINRTSGRDFSLSEAKQVAEYLNVKLNDFF